MKRVARYQIRSRRAALTVAVGVLAAALSGCGSQSATSPSATPTVATISGSGIRFIRGTVSDTAFRPLSGATVEVLDGPQTGLTATADARGQFSFSGNFDDTTRFRAAKDGHLTSTRTLEPYCERCAPNWWVNFSLEVTAAPVNLAGEYTFTFVADSICTTVPSELRTRTYTGVIPAGSATNPANAYYQVPLAGRTFYQQNWNVVGLGIAGDYVGFWLETLVEQIAPNTFLAFGGLAAASIGTNPGSTITLPFSGSVEYCVTAAPAGRFEDCRQQVAAADATCVSDNHRLILTRR